MEFCLTLELDFIKRFLLTEVVLEFFQLLYAKELSLDLAGANTKIL